jgi:hypothetical protein
MRYKIKVCRDLTGVENVVAIELMNLKHLSYMNLYALNGLRSLCICTQIELIVVYKEPCIVNTDVL